MKQEIAIYQRMADPVSAITKLGEMVSRSGLIKTTRPEQGALVAWVAMCENKTPFEVVRDYYFLDGGGLMKKTSAAVAEFRALGGRFKWKVTGDEATHTDQNRYAEADVTFDNQTITVRFSIADAVRLDVSFKAGSAWVKCPGRMLRKRVASIAIEMLAPEVYAGDIEEPGEDLPPNENTAAPSPASSPSISNVVVMPAPAASAPPPAASQVLEAEVVSQTSAPAPSPAAVTATAPAPAPAPAPTTAPAPDPAAASTLSTAPAPAAAPTKGQPAPGTGQEHMLPKETIAELEKALPFDEMDKIETWLVNKKWITPEQKATGTALAYISPENAKKILSAVDRFLKACRGV